MAKTESSTNPSRIPKTVVAPSRIRQSPAAEVPTQKVPSGSGSTAV